MPYDNFFVRKRCSSYLCCCFFEESEITKKYSINKRKGNIKIALSIIFI
jgi:hypothetical protein